MEGLDEAAMIFATYDHLDFPQWPEALRLYEQTFPKTGRKPDRIIRSMFAKRICEIHIVTVNGEVAAMAITGIVRKANVLLIDYVAVKTELRGQGIGYSFIDAIKDWAKTEMNLSGVIVEVEAEPTQENERRIRFWRRCGFVLTDYVHQYIWVPEPYRAMYAAFDSEPDFPADGETLFRHISAFHRKSFRA